LFADALKRSSERVEGSLDGETLGDVVTKWRERGDDRPRSEALSTAVALQLTRT
jgi:hypothetical protein